MVSCVFILLPAVFAFLYVRAFGVSVVYRDAWSIVPLFDKWSSGTLSVSDLWRFYNVHRMFFPSSVELLLGNITNYDNIVEMYLILICFLLTLATLFLAFRDDIKASWLFLFLPVSLLVFSFRQHENMLWGYQICFAFAQTFSVLALFLLYVLGRKDFIKAPFVAALGSATIASFSAAQGLFVWPAGLLQLFIGPLERPVKKPLIVLWGLAGVGEWVAYFIGYTNPPNNPSVLYVLKHPAVAMEYFLNLLGSSLFWQETFAFVGGLLLSGLAFVSFLLIHRYGRLSQYSFWVSLLLFSFLTMTFITLGRAGFGAQQALRSGYSSFSILAVVSVYAMVVKMALARRSAINTGLLAALAGVVLLSVALSYPEGIKEGNKEKALRKKAAFVLSTYESQPDEALVPNLVGDPKQTKLVRRRAPVLQRLGYNVFSERQARGLLPPPLSDLSPVASPPLYSVTVAGNAVSQDNQYIDVPKEASFIQLVGWAVDADNESTAGGVYIDIDGKIFPAFYGTDRQDVAEHLGVPSYRYSGFERALPISEIGAGTHEVSFVVLTTDKKGYYRSDQKVALKVR